jgi:hypothetical protein
MATIFPLVATPKEQHFGTVSKAYTRLVCPQTKPMSKEAIRIASIPVVAKPMYETEMDVTRAIADKSFRGFTSIAYEEARRYQAYLKAIQPKGFFAKKGGSPRPTGLNFRAGYCMC